MTGMRVSSGGGIGRAGFSLLELALVLAIMGVLAAIAVPRYGASLARYRAEVAARRVAADLAFAAGRARTTSTSQTVTFDPAAGGYLMPGAGSLKDGSADYRIDLTAAPYRAAIVSADFGGDATVVFDGYGMPDTGGSVVVRAGSFPKTIVLDADSGRAKVQ